MNRDTSKLTAFATAAAVALSATPALAHTGVGAGLGLGAGIGVGFLHPLGGLDHLLAMVAVGILATQQAQAGNRKALWALPAAFVAMMLAGGAAGLLGLGLPLVELGIASSVVLLGLALALGRKLPLAPAAAVVGLLAVFHGHAHGTEMPAAASGLAYGAGFALATALLHGVGLVLGLGARRALEKAAPVALRIAGGLTAAAGVAIAAA